AGGMGAAAGVQHAAPAPAPAVATAPATAPADDPAARLQKLKDLLDKSLISQAEFDTAKAEILKKLIG
ncbi:SHOCT domain-containing protein, partial [Cupriavidus sp. CuC1]|uniref:SHOCT domain-containing protein n=1 Tax=Cupriavidus sp. CuC1 TaxID=3373131 RepID=UPI0037D4D411